MRVRFYSSDGDYIMVEVTELLEYSLLKRARKYERRKKVRLTPKSRIESNGLETVLDWLARADAGNTEIALEAIGSLWDMLADSPAMTISFKQRMGQVQISVCTADPKLASNWSNFEVSTFRSFIEKLGDN